MLCSRCGKQSAQKYIRRTGDKEITMYLCPACHEELYPTGESDDFFSTLLSGVSGPEKTCPDCGTTLADFRRTGLLGCAHCYTAFREELIPTVQYIQGKIHHAGKEQSESAQEIYDMVRSLVNEQEAVMERLRRAERAGDAASIRRLKERLVEIGRRLSGEEA